LLGCTLAFKVRVQLNNRFSSVMKASTNPETIASIRSKLDTKMVDYYVVLKRIYEFEIYLIT